MKTSTHPGSCCIYWLTVSSLLTRNIMGGERMLSENRKARSTESMLQWIVRYNEMKNVTGNKTENYINKVKIEDETCIAGLIISKIISTAEFFEINYNSVGFWIGSTVRNVPRAAPQDQRGRKRVEWVRDVKPKTFQDLKFKTGKIVKLKMRFKEINGYLNFNELFSAIITWIFIFFCIKPYVQPHRSALPTGVKAQCFSR